MNLQVRQSVPRQSIYGVLIDVDNTVYPSSTGLEFDAHQPQGSIVGTIRECIRVCEESKHGCCTLEWAANIQNGFFKAYGNSYPAIRDNYGWTDEEIAGFVYHAGHLDYARLKPCGKTVAQCAQLAQKRLIAALTNGTRRHGEAVIDIMGLTNALCFVRGYDDNNYVPKPHSSAFRLMAKAMGLPLENVLYIDDSMSNLTAAHKLGCGYRVLIRENGDFPPDDGPSDDGVVSLCATHISTALAAINDQL